MSVISIERHHNLSPAELRERIDAIMIKVGQRLEFQSEWENDQYLSFRRRGASGNIEVGDNRFAITIRLGIMFRALKGVIASEIEDEIDKQLK